MQTGQQAFFKQLYNYLTTAELYMVSKTEKK